MDCNDTRRMLERGVAPGSASAPCALLGFHLASCATCRAYRKQVEISRLLTALLAQPTPSLALALREPPATVRRRSLSARQSAGAALLIATALAAVPLGQAVSAQATALAPDAATLRLAAPAAAAQQPAPVAAAWTFKATSANLPMQRVQIAPNSVRPPPDDELLLAHLHALAVPARPQPAALTANNAVTDWALFAPNQAIDTVRSQIAAFAQAGPQALPPQVLDFVIDPAIATLPLQAGQTLVIPADPPVPEPPPPVVIAPDINVPAQPRPTVKPAPRPTAKPTAKPTKPPVAVRPPTQSSQFSYQIQPGDTLSSIALRFYDSAGRWPELYRANRALVGSNPNLIYPNLRLVIPGVRGSGSGAGSTTTGQAYAVRGGDTLSDIALRFYGNANLWPLIYSANRGTIGSNPDLIFPQQQIAIPRSQAAPRPTAQPTVRPTAQPTQTPNNQLPPPLVPIQGRYTVLRGDSLRSIAQRAYGNEARWRDIYQANRANIPNPDALRVGVILDLLK